MHQIAGINPMIQEAMDRGEDATGLCTIRQLAADMLNSPRICGECVTKMSAYRTTYRGFGLESWRAASRYEHRNWCMVVQHGIEYFVGFTQADARAFIDALIDA